MKLATKQPKQVWLLVLNHNTAVSRWPAMPSLKKKERKNINVLLNLSVSVANMLYLNLHLEVGLEVGQQSEEYGERQLKDLRHRGDSVFGQGHTQVLFDGVDEHFICFENGPSILQDG